MEDINISENVVKSNDFLTEDKANKLIKTEVDFMLSTNWQEQSVNVENFDEDQYNKILQDTKMEITENPLKIELDKNNDVLSDECNKNTSIKNYDSEEKDTDSFINISVNSNERNSNNSEEMINKMEKQKEFLVASTKQWIDMTSIVHKCQGCNTFFNSKISLDYHILATHAHNKDLMNSVTSKIHSCDKCKYKTVFKNRYRDHQKQHKGKEADKVHQCTLCDYKATRKNLLEIHVQLHTGELPFFLCQACKKKFRKKRELDSHIVAIHPGDQALMNKVTSKLHSCEICQYKTVGLDRFRKHAKSHKSGYLHRCNTCGHTFTKKHLLVKHMQLHNVEPNVLVYEDKISFKSNLASGRLASSLRQKETILCRICNICFRGKQQLDGHILTLHSDDETMMNSISCQIYSCDNCEFKTVWVENITGHCCIRLKSQ